MIIYTYKSKDNTNGRRLETTWPELARRLRKTVRTEETMAEYAKTPRNTQGEIKDVGGFIGGEMNGPRCKANVGGRWLITLDIDHGAKDEWEDFTALYAHGDGQLINCCAYPTHSWTPDDQHWRWVFPLTRPVSPTEYRRLAALLLQWVGERGKDDTTDQPERLMYWPSCPRDMDYDALFHAEVTGRDLDPDELLPACPELPARRERVSARRGDVDTGEDVDIIPCGSRNNALTSVAGRLRNLGLGYREIRNTLEATNDTRCEEPLDDEELDTIARSVARYEVGDRALTTATYRGELDFNDLGLSVSADLDELDDVCNRMGLTDLTIASCVKDAVGDQVLYAPGLGVLLWTRDHYEASELSESKANCLLSSWVNITRDKLGRVHQQLTTDMARARNYAEEDKAAAIEKQLALVEVQLKFVDRYGNRGKRDAATKDWLDMVARPDDDFDADAFLLNTPDGVVDLRTGGIKPCAYEYRCTKVTRSGPGEEGRDMWRAFLDNVTAGDKEIQLYMQQMFGLAAIGKVMEEGMFFIIGEGGNGKSTMVNAIRSVLGSYAGGLGPQVLLVDKNNNSKAEKAALRGKRLVVAAELEENQILSSQQVKAITSTDPIHGEAKYVAPTDFTPTHTVVLFSNFLPRIPSTDKGTWRRVWPIPFDVPQKGRPGEVLNYADVLAEKAGPAIMQWLVDGAVAIGKNGYKLPECTAVQLLKQRYMEEENPLPRFLQERCVACEDPGRAVTTGELVEQYNLWARAMHEFERTPKRLSLELQRLGYGCEHKKRGAVWPSLRLRDSNDDIADRAAGA